MFTKEKVIDHDNIKRVINFINREEVELFRGENMIFATNRMLSYDEASYLSEHLELINYEEDRKYLLEFINKWKVIIENINLSLENGTLEEYLIETKSFPVIPKIFGFEREGVQLTEIGVKVSLVANKLLMKQVDDMKKRITFEENTILVENQINKKR